MIAGPVFGTLLILAAQNPSRTDVPREPLRTAPAPERPGARAAAEELVRHLYAVYLAVRACTEAGQQLGKPEFTPAVPLEEARRTMRMVDAAAKEVGIDVDRIWADVGPLGLITAEAIKADTPGNLANCRNIGGIFRIDLGNLQNALRQLGSQRALIEKDF